jgi:hypothetical protein
VCLWPVFTFYCNPPVRNTKPKYKHRLQAAAILSWYIVQETVIKVHYFVKTVPYINTRQHWRRSRLIRMCICHIFITEWRKLKKYVVRMTSSDKTFILSFVKICEIVQPFTGTERHIRHNCYPTSLLYLRIQFLRDVTLRRGMSCLHLKTLHTFETSEATHLMTQCHSQKTLVLRNNAVRTSDLGYIISLTKWGIKLYTGHVNWTRVNLSTFVIFGRSRCAWLLYRSLKKTYDCVSDFVINNDCRVRTGNNSIWLGSA